MQILEKKWTDRAGALDALLDGMKKMVKLTGESRDYADTVQALKLYVADSNQVVRELRSVLICCARATCVELALVSLVCKACF